MSIDAGLVSVAEPGFGGRIVGEVSTFGLEGEYVSRGDASLDGLEGLWEGESGASECDELDVCARGNDGLDGTDKLDPFRCF